jgi:dihydropteroate synthase
LTAVRPEAPPWRLAGGKILDPSRALVMGILNVTPDSFSDGGELIGSLDRALARARAMVEAGAALLDVGGESTRPGAASVSEAEEIDRVVPVVESIARVLDVPVSVDTRKASVARAALDAGATIVNDVSGLAHDPALAGLVAERGAGLVLMHMRGQPADMMEHASYGDVVAEVRDELGAALGRARAAGIDDDAVVIDPGLGFAKTAEHNLSLIHRLDVLAALGRPVLVGPSRKSFLGRILDVPPAERVTGTVAACVAAYLLGARIFRVHDVAPAVAGLRVAEAIACEAVLERAAAAKAR